MIRLRYLTRPWTFLLSACVVATALAETSTTGNWKTDANQAWQSAQQDQRPMLLFITMQNCVYCRKMEQNTFTNQQVVAGIQQSFIPVTVAADRNEALVRKLRVATYPTTVIISPNGGVLDYMVGYVGPDEFTRRLDAATRRSDTASVTTRHTAR